MEDRKVVFFYDGHGYDIDDVDWHKEKKYCVFKNKECAMKRDDGDNCVCTLVQHTCKHVVNGNSDEKQFYSEAMPYMGKESIIPVEIKSESDSVVTDYKEMSLVLLNNPSSIGLSGQGKHVRVVCNGNGFLNGLTDYMGFYSIRGCTCLALVSSYYNISSSDIYILYSLLHQRFYEGKERGENVSPVVRCFLNDGLKETDISDVEMAMDQAGLWYKPGNDGNHTLGAIYQYCWDRYCNKPFLSKMYQEIVPLFPSNSLSFDIKKSVIQKMLLKSGPNDELLKIISKYERIYVARTILEYIQLIAGDKFDYTKNLPRNYQEALPSLHHAICEFDLRISGFYELALQKKLLERFNYVFEERLGKAGKEMSKFIADNEKEDNTVGSIADQATFSSVNWLIEYFMVLYVFCRGCCGGTGIFRSMGFKAIVRDEVDTWFRHYDNFKNQFKGQLFDTWIRNFNDIFQFDERRKEFVEYRTK